MECGCSDPQIMSIVRGDVACSKARQTRSERRESEKITVSFMTQQTKTELASDRENSNYS